MSEPIRISASRLKTLKDCSLKFYYENIVMLPSDSHVKTRQGSALHRIFELILKPRRATLFRALVMEPENAVIPPSILRYIRIYDHYNAISPYEMSTMVSMLRVAFAGIRTYFIDSSTGAYTPPPRVLSEHRFKIELGEATISGVIDLLLLWEAHAVVIDLKSQGSKFLKREMADNIQAAMYMLAVRHEFGFIPFVDFVMLRHPPTKRNPDLHLQRTPALSTGALDGLAEYLKDMYGVVNSFGLEEAMSHPHADEGFCTRVCPFLRPFDYLALVPKSDPSIITPLKTFPLDKAPQGGDTGNATIPDDQMLVKRGHLGCASRWSQ